MEILRARGVEFDVIEYLHHPPDETQLRRFLELLGCDPREMVHPGSFEELGLDLDDYAGGGRPRGAAAGAPGGDATAHLRARGPGGDRPAGGAGGGDPRLREGAMATRQRYWFVLVLGSLGPGSLGWALPPCGPPGDHHHRDRPGRRRLHRRLQRLQDLPAGVPERRGRCGRGGRPGLPQLLSAESWPWVRRGASTWPTMTIIYRLEDDGSATRIAGVPQYSSLGKDRTRAGGSRCCRTTMSCRTRWRPWTRALPRGRWPSTGTAGSTSSTMSTAEEIRGQRPASPGSKRTGS